jgi:hypothetical protein
MQSRGVVSGELPSRGAESALSLFQINHSEVRLHQTCMLLYHGRSPTLTLLWSSQHRGANQRPHLQEHIRCLFRCPEVLDKVLHPSSSYLSRGDSFKVGVQPVMLSNPRPITQSLSKTPRRRISLRHPDIHPMHGIRHPHQIYVLQVCVVHLGTRQQIHCYSRGLGQERPSGYLTLTSVAHCHLPESFHI